MSLQGGVIMFFTVVRQDLRRIRLAWKASSTIIATLAIGVMASTTLFALVYIMILQPLPYPDSARLVYIAETNSTGGAIPAAAPDVEDWRQENHTLSAIAGYGGQPITVIGGSYPVRVYGSGVSRDFFKVMQVQPILGRVFLPEEQRLHGTPAVIVSRAFWSEQLKGATEVLGTRLRILDMDFTVVGVMPEGFDFPDKSQIWISREIFPNSTDRSAHNDFVVGRLRDGSTLAEARTELQQIARELQSRYPTSNAGIGVQVDTLQSYLLGEQRQALLIGFGVGICVLLIAAANLANLFLSRVLTRQNELLIREAFGATRWGLVVSLLREAALLSVAGGLVGLLGAYCGILAARSHSDLWAPMKALNFNWTVAGYALLIAVGTGCFAALVATINLRFRQTLSIVRGSSMTSTSDRKGNRVRNMLVAAEVAVAFVICISAGLLVHAWQRVSSVPTGLREENMLVVNLSLPTQPGSENAVAQQTNAFYDSLLNQTSSLPGVLSAAVVNDVPFSGNDHDGQFTIEGENSTASKQWIASFRVVSPSYFQTTAIPMLEGRLFSAEDALGTAGVAIIDAETKARYFGNSNPIGRRIRLDGLDEKPAWLTIVGVCGRVRDIRLTLPETTHIYVPYTQHPAAMMESGLVVRSGMQPTALVAPVRALVGRLQRDGVAEFTTTSSLLAASLANFRTRASLVLVLSLVALALSALGVYALSMTTVRERRKEIAIRIALGASIMNTLRFVLVRGLTPVGYGAIVGLSLSYWLAATLKRYLFGVEVWDPTTLLLVPAILLATGVLANLLPALKSAKVNTIEMLRQP
jgi:putative ABC transport system permease protein